MSITPIGLAAQATGKVTTEANGRLGKTDFLTMLTTQMRYQDPLNPMDNTAMIAQMAQFSQLEQMLNMTHAFTALQTVALLGKTVTALNTQGQPFMGVVKHVAMNDETPVMTLGAPNPALVPPGVIAATDGDLVAMKDVQDVTY